MTIQYVQPGLILARRAGEILVLELPEALGAQRVIISCVQVDRNQAKIGIQCPRSWNIFRGELKEMMLSPDHTIHHNR